MGKIKNRAQLSPIFYLLVFSGVVVEAVLVLVALAAWLDESELVAFVLVLL